MMEKYTMEIRVPSYIQEVTTLLESSGYSCYVVGGAVRDLFLGLEPKDWDLTTNATVSQMEEVFLGFQLLPTGIDHGTMTLRVPYQGDKESVEITTFRKDGIYFDGRHPSSVEHTDDIYEDLSRRDFTINALAYRVSEGVVYHYPDGVSDLSRGIIRLVGHSYEDKVWRLIEDPLRMLRAVRFASRYGFKIENETVRAIWEKKYLLYRVSVERIQDELNKTLMSKYVKFGLEYMNMLGLLEIVSPMHKLLDGLEQSYPHNSDVLGHTFEVVGQLLGSDGLMLKLAGFFHDIGKSLTRTVGEDGRIHFYEHERVGAKVAEVELRRLKYPNILIDRVVWLVGNHMIQEELSKKGIRRLVSRCKGDYELVRDCIELRKADLRGRVDTEFCTLKLKTLEGLEEVLQEVELEKVPMNPAQLDLTGTDIMREFSLEPGRVVGSALNYLMEKVLDGDVENKKGSLLKELYEGKSEWVKMEGY